MEESRRDFHVARDAQNLVVVRNRFAVRVTQASVNEINGERRNIYADPVSTELLGRINGRATATERIEDEVALLASGADDSFQQGEWFLGWITKTFSSTGIDGVNINPHVTNNCHPLRWNVWLLGPLPRHPSPLPVDTVTSFEVFKRGVSHPPVASFSAGVNPAPGLTSLAVAQPLSGQIHGSIPFAIC